MIPQIVDNEYSIVPLENETVDYKRYPLIRYMGSKYRLLDWIYATLSEIDFDTAFDGFSGSGAVSYLLKSMGKKVYTNDFLHFSYQIAKATTENNNTIIDELDKKYLFDKKATDYNFISNTYDGIFYSAEDRYFLDYISQKIHNLKNEHKCSLALSALIRSCAKKQPRGVFTISGDISKYNDGRRDLRLSIEEHFLEQLEEYNNIIFDNKRENKSFNMDVFDFDNKRYQTDLVYFDPPYVPNSDDNDYIKRYHFLEGLSKYWKNEEIMFETKVRKIKKKYTPFSYRRTAVDAFDTLFKKFRNSIIVLSYSSNGYPELKILVELMAKYKTSVDVHKKEHRYNFGNHKNVKRSVVDEYLIVGK